MLKAAPAAQPAILRLLGPPVLPIGLRLLGAARALERRTGAYHVARPPNPRFGPRTLAPPLAQDPAPAMAT